MRYQVTEYPTFCTFYASARESSARIRASTPPGATLPYSGTYYVAPDHQSGYGISRTGELLAVWSRVPGRGPGLVHDALWRGAQRLTCPPVPHLRVMFERAGFHVWVSHPARERGRLHMRVGLVDDVWMVNP